MNTDTTPTPSYELEKGICKSKVDSLLCDPDRKVTGYFLTKEDGSVCMVDKGAVRWITKEEWWWIFHESNQYPKESQLSDRDHNEVARLREELKERIETQNTFALALLEKPERDVARLRELLNRAIEIAERLVNGACGEWGCIGHTDEVDQYGKELITMKTEARLTPAPEEPVSEGTRIAAEARSACNDLTEEERKRYASLAEDVLGLWRRDGRALERTSRKSRGTNQATSPPSKTTTRS